MDDEQEAAIGVRPYTLDRRIRLLGWDKERAITTPPRKAADRSRWRSVAEGNGITPKQFYDRVTRRGWTEERAATEPLCSPERYKELAAQASERNRKYPREIIELRKRNGISIQTFHYRVQVCGWPLERAATEPPWPREKIGRSGAEAVRLRYGDLHAGIFQKKVEACKS